MTGVTIQRMRAAASQHPMMFASGVKPEEVKDAESRLRCRFDASYGLFLREFGGAMVGPDPILGLRQAEVMGDDLWSVVDVTERFRADGWPQTEDWYVISVDAAGNPIGGAPDGAIYVSDHHGGAIRKVADSFDDFIAGRLATMS